MRLAGWHRYTQLCQAVNAGGITFLTWTEHTWPYIVSGGLSQDELRAVADGMETLPLVRWQERLRALS